MTLSIITLTLGILGNAMSIFAYSSAIPTFWRIVKRKKVDDFSAHPYVFSLLNCMLWSFYGLLNLEGGGLMIFTVNAIGCAFQYVYIVLFMAFSPNRKRISTGLLTGGVHVAFVVLLLVVEFLIKQASIQARVMGVSSCMAAIAMFTSPLFIMGIVVSTKSVEYMPFLLSFSFMLRSGTWCAYGYVTRDIFVEITNTIGVSMAITQLVLYFIYCRKPFQKKLIKDVNLDDAELSYNMQGMKDHNDVKLALDNPTFLQSKEGEPLTKNLGDSELSYNMQAMENHNELKLASKKPTVTQSKEEKPLTENLGGSQLSYNMQAMENPNDIKLALDNPTFLQFKEEKPLTENLGNPELSFNMQAMKNHNDIKLALDNPTFLQSKEEKSLTKNQENV